MPARGQAGDDDRPLDAVLAGLCVEPVERAFQLVGDLRQGRLRRQRVAAQSRRPTASQRTLGEAGKDLLAAALPIAAVNVNEAWVPLIAFSVSISQVEMLRALFPQRLRSCGPAFGFLARVLGAYVLDIVICEIAVLERHCNPVHAGSGAFLRTKRCRNASGSCRHEGATTKRCHIDLPGYWGSAAANPRFATTSPTEHPNASPLSELCKLFPILQGQLASFTLFALVWDMPLLRRLARMPQEADDDSTPERACAASWRRSCESCVKWNISLRAYRVTVNGSGSRHFGSAAQWHNRTHAPQQSCTVRQCQQPASRCLLLSVSYSAACGSEPLRMTLQMLCGVVGMSIWLTP